MITNRISLAALLLLLAPACDAASDKGAGGGEQPAGQAVLAQFTSRGTIYPYARYLEVTGRPGNRGQIFYFYPRARVRNELLMLDNFGPDTSVEANLGTEILGDIGPVIREGGQLRIDFLPISLPIGVAPSQEWRLRYGNRDLICRSRAAVDSGASSDALEVSCSNPSLTLTFQFDRERGVTQYQNLCDAAICTYRLEDRAGILSRAAQAHMGLPAI